MGISSKEAKILDEKKILSTKENNPNITKYNIKNVFKQVSLKKHCPADNSRYSYSRSLRLPRLPWAH